MKCLRPLTAYFVGYCRCLSDGVISPRLTFSFKEAEEYFCRNGSKSIGYALIDKNTINLPCGKCAACMIEKRKQMSTRLSLEAQVAYESCFITLTYNDEHIPTTDFKPLDDESKEVVSGFGSLPLPTLVPADVQRFIKRLRRHLEYVPSHAFLQGRSYYHNTKKSSLGAPLFLRDHREKIRYFAVGEYGGKSGRPHYHILIFGWKPSDLVAHEMRGSYIISRSAQVEKLWKFGFSTVCEVNTGVAKYCARYVTKKFARLSEDNPFKDSVVPEFTLQSVRDGGMGAPFFDAYWSNIIDKGFVTIRNGDKFSKCAIPKYFYRRLRQKHLRSWLDWRQDAIAFAKSGAALSDPFAVIRQVECYHYQYKNEIQRELL